MQETGDRLLLVQSGARGEIERIDAVELVVGAFRNKARNGLRDRGIGGGLERREPGEDVGHADEDRTDSRRAQDAARAQSQEHGHPRSRAARDIAFRGWSGRRPEVAFGYWPFSASTRAQAL